VLTKDDGGGQQSIQKRHGGTMRVYLVALVDRITESDPFIGLAHFERELELCDGLTTKWKPIDV
jgi:hypothetical protein